MVHFLNPHIGEDIQPPVKFLPPNAKVAGLILIDNVLYAATADNCGGAPDGIWALDLGRGKTDHKMGVRRGQRRAARRVRTFASTGTPYVGRRRMRWSHSSRSR